MAIRKSRQLGLILKIELSDLIRGRQEFLKQDIKLAIRGTNSLPYQLTS